MKCPFGGVNGKNTAPLFVLTRNLAPRNKQQPVNKEDRSTLYLTLKHDYLVNVI